MAYTPALLPGTGSWSFSTEVLMASMFCIPKDLALHPRPAAGIVLSLDWDQVGIAVCCCRPRA